MTRDEFEFLLSQWLDEPARADLGAAVADAVAAEPEFAALRDEWVRFDRATRTLIARPASIDWRRQAEHLRATLVAEVQIAEPADVRLDALLGALPTPPVDWAKLGGRIASAARGAERGRQSQRILWTAAITAAAAILAFILLRPSMPGMTQPHATMVAIAVVEQTSPAAFSSAARVEVTVGRSGGDAPVQSRPSVESEFFLMIDPAPTETAAQVSAVADEDAGWHARTGMSAARTAMID